MMPNPDSNNHNNINLINLYAAREIPH